MEQLLISIFTILCFVSGSIGRKGFGPGEQEWGYVEVRPDAHMFWWLYYTTADVKSYYDKPLIIWLQGGPGESSSGVGNFEELGPLDVNLNPRNYTWVKNYNVLFIDNPVGTGFSYVNGTAEFVTTNAEIASDLLECIRGFYKQLPKFKSVPTYISTESYGGKMGAEFVLVWDRAQKNGTIESNLKGITLGSSWISPIDSVMNWAPFLLNMGIVDTRGFEIIGTAAKQTKDDVETGKWLKAFYSYATTYYIILNTTYNVDLYNILNKKNYSSNLSPQSISSFDKADTIHRHSVQSENDSLSSLMNGPVKEALSLEVTYDNQSYGVYHYLREEFMKPVINIVELLLNETNLNVFVINGHMDLLVDIWGTGAWLEKLKWKGADTWKTETIREPLVVEDIVEGYVKAQDNFRMYWILRSGHKLPNDNPAAMGLIMQELTTHSKK